MMKPSILVSACTSLLATAAAVTLAGCAAGNVVLDNATDTVAPAIHGIIHGGPNPVVGARVVIYATTSNGYGIGTPLQEANQTGTSAHQDTDSNGNFNFAGGFTCPAGQYAYVVAYGGNTGANSNNPNSVLMLPMGACSTLYSGTTYQGGNLWINESTTVAAAYALANFIAVTGDAVNGYTVGVGAPATNNNASGTGCVANAYYGATCTTTAAAGLGHAFNNALALVNTSNGAYNATTTNSAIVPVTQLNTISNIVQACVNSNGGGTSATTGQPSTTTTSSGASHDGTVCGKLSAFTSYTNTGLSSGTLTAGGNTLSDLLNLVKRPTGSAATFDGACDSNSGSGSNTAVSCLYSLIPATTFYNPYLTTTPGDFMVGISYPRASLSTSTTSTFQTPSSPSCATNSTTNNGLLYPTWVQSDINDDVLILNADASTPICANVIEIGPDGTVVGASAIDNGAAAVVSLGLDSWGHVMVPIKGGTSNSAAGIKVYQYQPLGAPFTSGDNSLSLAQTITGGGATNVGYKPDYVQVDGTGRLYAVAQNSTNDFGYFTITQNHSLPTYTLGPNLGTPTTSSMYNIGVDINNNAFALNSAEPTGTGGTNYVKATASGDTTSGTYYVMAPDTSGNIWNVVNNGSTAGTSQTMVLKYPYTSSGGTLAWGSSATTSSPTYSYPILAGNTALNQGLNVGAKAGVMDGNNVLWFPDFSGSTTTTPATGSWLRGYDTVNNYGTPQLQGCKFSSVGVYSITGWTISGSSTTFNITGSSPALNAIVTLSGFTTSTFFNNTGQLTVTGVGTGTFTVGSNFGQGTSSNTETGTATGRTPTTCGNNNGDTTNPSNTPFLMYSTRGITVDSMGNLWVANGTQGTVSEILSIAAPTWANYIHSGTSNKP